MQNSLKRFFTALITDFMWYSERKERVARWLRIKTKRQLSPKEMELACSVAITDTLDYRIGSRQGEFGSSSTEYFSIATGGYRITRRKYKNREISHSSHGWAETSYGPDVSRVIEDQYNMEGLLIERSVTVQQCLVCREVIVFIVIG